VSAQSADRLVVLLSLASFLFVVPLRLRHVLSMTVQRDHHRGLGSRVDVLGSFGALVLPRAVVQRGHAQIQCQASLFAEPLDGADLAR